MSYIQISSMFEGYRIIMNEKEEYFVDEIEINGQKLELSGDMSVEYDHMEHDHRSVNLVVS